MNNDLISRKALLELYEDYEGLGLRVSVDVLILNIEDQPPVDAVEVVRCNDCVYKIKNAFGLGIICDKIGTYMPNNNSYCSYGAKMDGDKDD